MSLLSDNVIPGNHGKVFETDASKETHLETIKKVIAEISGVKDVIIDSEKFPHQITIHTSSIVKVKDIEDAVKKTGFHAIPKGLFEL